MDLQKFYDGLHGVESDWHGFRKIDFTLEGIPAIVVKPSAAPAKELPWYWRARFFGAFPYADFALLRLGWHVVHIQIEELYGSPESARRFDLLYDFMTRQGFNRRTALAGYSRGGLDVSRWAAANPDKVSCLYLDNAVCDMKSWPGGKGTGPGAADGWQNCLKAWNFTEEQAMSFRGNPVDLAETLTAQRMPVLFVAALADTVVPYEENTAVMVRRMEEAGGHPEVIRKPGADHHPHCLENPAPIVDFILKAQAAADAV